MCSIIGNKITLRKAVEPDAMHRLLLLNKVFIYQLFKILFALLLMLLHYIIYYHKCTTNNTKFRLINLF